MQKTVRFLEHHPKRDWDNDDFVCAFVFSVIDTRLIGTPYETETTHKLKVILSDHLMINWRLWDAGSDGISDDMIKVAFQSAEEYISTMIQRGVTLGEELQPLVRTTENSPKLCPYRISNITYPVAKDSFVVDFNKMHEFAHPLEEIQSESMDHIFISYSHKDKKYVHKLQEALQREGFEVWIDDRIDFGTQCSNPHSRI